MVNLLCLSCRWWYLAVVWAVYVIVFSPLRLLLRLSLRDSGVVRVSLLPLRRFPLAYVVWLGIEELLVTLGILLAGLRCLGGLRDLSRLLIVSRSRLPVSPRAPLFLFGVFCCGVCGICRWCVLCACAGSAAAVCSMRTSVASMGSRSRGIGIIRD